MRLALADTSFLFAQHSSTDLHHKKINNYLKRIREKEIEPISFILTDFVFAELITRIAHKVHKKHAISVIEKIKKDPFIKIEHITPELFDETMKVYKKYEDKLWSFTDFISYTYMKAKGIKIIAATGHVHIKQFGFRIIPE